MKVRPLALILCLLFLATQVSVAQKEKSVKKEKEYVIISKKEGEEGKEKVKRIVIRGKDGNVVVDEDKNIEFDGDVIILEDKDKEGNVFFFSDGEMPHGHHNININEKDGKKHIVIEFKDENGEEQRIEWEGEGEVPEHIQKYLHESKNNMEFDHWDVRVEVDEEEHAFLGVMLEEKETVTIEVIDGEEKKVESVDIDDTPGVRIDDVIEGSAAEEAGLQGGDLILSIDDQAINNFGELSETLKGKEIGEEINIQYRREGEELETQATLKSSREAGAQSKLIWVEDAEKEGMDGEERVFIFRSGEPMHQKHKIIIIGKDQEEENQNAISDPLPELELERSLELETFEVFPNPGEGQIRLKFTSEAAPTTVRVLDLSGKEVYREYMRDFSGLYDDSIDLDQLNSGMYILTIEQEGKIFSEQLVIR